jgi:hypothetical protein
MGKLRPVVGAESKSQSMTSALSMINEMARRIGIRTVAPASRRTTGTTEQGSAIRAQKRLMVTGDVAPLAMSGNLLRNLLWGLPIAGHAGTFEGDLGVLMLRRAKSGAPTCGSIVRGVGTTCGSTNEVCMGRREATRTTVFEMHCSKSTGLFVHAVVSRSASFLQLITSIMTALKNVVHTAIADIGAGWQSSRNSPASGLCVGTVTAVGG